VSTLFGRRRRLPEAKSSKLAKVNKAKRAAVNFIIQGTAADLHKLSLIALHRSLPYGCRLLLTMHDAVLVEVPTWLIEEATEQIRQAMTATPAEFSVPLKVEIGVGQNWAECKMPHSFATVQ
jgi:DNA polymerase-1